MQETSDLVGNESKTQPLQLQPAGYKLLQTHTARDPRLNEQ